MDWPTQDAFLVGPYAPPEPGTSHPFQVPSEPLVDFHIGRIHPGPAWPAGVEPLARLAAVPSFDRDRVGEACAPDQIVLFAEDAAGGRTPICGRRSEGDFVWNSNPAGWIDALLTERYVRDWTRPLPSRVPLLNYSFIPNAIKGALQPSAQLDANRSNAIAFPGVPLDDLVERLRQLFMALACGAPARTLPVWPSPYRAAVTLSHDVDTSWILERAQRPTLERILTTETDLGYRGAWYITAKRFDRRRHGPAVEAIREAGHEVGAHGWNHDAKLDYLSRSRQERRMRLAAERFKGLGSTGIRTPWYCRSEQLMGVIGSHFAYSSSVPNSSAFYSRETNSGCCTVLPYRPRPGLFELPLTLPPDTTGPPDSLYPLLEGLVERIIALGGVVVATLHPQPHQSANDAGLRGFTDFIREMKERRGTELWQATPGEIVDRYRKSLTQDAE